ncbi:c-type cytochrome [Thermus thermamylovorans]|uniref:Cytochrome c n=1 Tax=Thermus thermamylovorans TaxID=2509362 RepID=A0A4V6MRG8_9DEIN|nr:cytochrome c [Thermus thermamylovorans]TBH21255.1 cytochrome c [Thermus thermamylovorans]
MRPPFLLGLLLLLAALALLAARLSPPRGGGEAAAYARHCQACHGPSGEGVAGIYPPLSEVGFLAASPEGRAYLVQSVLRGLPGGLVVEGTAYRVPMPGFSRLRDAELAAALNHVLALLGAEAAPFTPEEVQALRGEALSPQEVLRSRPPVP